MKLFLSILLCCLVSMIPRCIKFKYIVHYLNLLSILIINTSLLTYVKAETKIHVSLILFTTYHSSISLNINLNCESESK